MKRITKLSAILALFICLTASTSTIIQAKCKQPAAFVGSPATICSGKPVLIGGKAVAGNIYVWTSNPSGFSSSQSNPIVSPTTTTSYTLTETVVATGCSKSNSVVITALQLPAAEAGSDQSICSGRCTTIGGPAVSGSTYTWSLSGDGFNVNDHGVPINKLTTATVTVCGAHGVGSAITTYTVTETNSNGCSNSHSVRISVYSQPKATSNTPRTINSGECVTIGSSSTAGDTYTWFSTPAGFNSNSPNPSVCPTETTIYKVVETNSAGCTFANSYTVNVLPPSKQKKARKD